MVSTENRFVTSEPLPATLSHGDSAGKYRLFRVPGVLISGASALSRSYPRILTAKKAGAPTKSEVLSQIAEETELSRKQVAGVFDSLSEIIRKSLRSHGMFTVLGLVKLKVVKKPATKARKGVNPFTGETMMFKAKPASKKVRGMALKNLKAMVN